MNGIWMVAAVVVAAMPAQAEMGSSAADARVTVYIYDRIGVRPAVLAQAMHVATAAFATAGIEVRWVEGKPPAEPLDAGAGEVVSVVFDGAAQPASSPYAMAATTMGGRIKPQVRMFYDRITSRAASHRGRVQLPQILGNVLAHELTHALQGVARHSRDGLMKEAWSYGDIAGMAAGPLAFTAADVTLLRARFCKRTSDLARSAVTP